MTRWHPFLLAGVLAIASLAVLPLGGTEFAPWLLVGVTAGFATSGST
ncbi:hypothetical protein [Saccharothrix syringae]|nr:hypothetical protein [Saccharothrix syringae]